MNDVEAPVSSQRPDKRHPEICPGRRPRPPHP